MQLGKTDLRVSRIGFGCWAIGGHGWGKIDDQISVLAIRKALDRGVNFFDTADVYGFGHSEEVLSKALGSKRHDVVIATKFGVTWDEKASIGRNCSPQYLVSALENSLRRLKLDCIQLYQIHWPDINTPIENTIEALQKCQNEGKIKHFGVSNFTNEHLVKAQLAGRLESLQCPYSLIRRDVEKDLLPHSSLNHIGVIVYDALAKGLLTGKFNLDSKFHEDDVRSRDPEFIGERYKVNLKLVDRLVELGMKYNKSAGQVALRWILDNSDITCVLTGVKQPEQIEENVGALDWRLEEADRSLLTNWTNEE